MRKIVKSLLALSILGVTGGTAAAGAVIFNNATYQPAEETVAAAVATHYISSESDLTQMALNISQGVGVYALDTYQLTNDITLTGALWTPFGTSSKPFKGTFLGNGYTISGNITLDTSTLDSNYGLFGAIEGAKIYDFTLDGSFNYPAAGGTAGSLVGTAKNSIIAAVNIKNVSDLDLIGSSDNNSVYTTGDEGHIGSTARTGRVVTFDANGGYFADGNNKPLTRPKKTATDTNLGTEKRTKYYVALKGTAPQTLTHAPNNFGTVYPVDVNEDGTFKAVRDGYVLANGKKWIGSDKAGHTNFDLSGVNYNLQANWDQVKYKFTFENKAGSVSLSSGTPADVTVPMYMPWSTLVEGGKVSIGGTDTEITKLSKPGYDLVELKIGTKTYCKRTISYDTSGNQIDGVWSYPNGNNINLGNKHGDFTVTANWQPKKVNLTVQYTYTNGGSGARNAAKFSIVEKASDNAFLTKEGTDEGSEKYVIKGAASVKYSFNLKAGYDVDSFVVNEKTIKKDETAESGYAYSYTIKGEAFEGLTADETNRTITINLKRIQQTITISAPNTDITLSNNTTYTLYSSGTLTTYADEKFTITFKAGTGYRIKGVTPKGFATETTLTYDSIPLTGKGSISVSIKEYAYTFNSPTITLSTGQVEVAFNVVQTGPKASGYEFAYPTYDLAGRTNSGRVGYSESLRFITNTNDYYRVSKVNISKFITTFTSGTSVELFGTTYTGTLNGSVLTMTYGENSFIGSNGSILIDNIDYTYTISGNDITLTYAGDETPTIQENAITGTSAYGHYTITITYVKNTKELTFDANGGSWDDGLPYSVYVVPVSGSLQYTDAAGKTGYAFNGATKQLVPKRTGYTFKGYSLTKNNVDTKIINYNANEETKWSSVSGKTWEAITANTTLYAIWQANTYTVEFDRASGSDGMVRITVTYGSTPSNIRVPKRTGYIFGGYYTKANGYGKQYFDERGTATCVWDIASDTTLYEQWTPISYEIIYSSCDIEPTTATYDKGFKVTNPTKTGYKFTGWTITGMDTTKHVIGGTETNDASAENVMATTFKNLHSTDGATVNFKANWNPITYDINYSLNNGSEAAQTTAIYDVEFTVANPTKTGYTFTGWTITGMDTTKHVIGEVTITDESKSGVMATKFKNLHSTKGAKVNFEANWTAKEYTLTYDGNGTTTGVPSGNTISYGGSMLPSSNPTSSNPTRTGYLFAGWAINKYYDNKNHTYIFNLQNGATKDSFKARVNGSDAIITVLSGTNFSTDNFGTDAAATALFGDTDITVYALWILDAANLKLKYTEITAVSAINSVEGKYPAWKPAITSIGDSLQYLITSYNGDNVTFKIEPYYEGKVFVDGLASTSFKKEHKLERGSSGTLSYEDKLGSLDTVVLPFKDTTLTGTLEYSTTFVANIYNKTANGGIKNFADDSTYESLAEYAAIYYTMRRGSHSPDLNHGLKALQELINRMKNTTANLEANIESVFGMSFPHSIIKDYKELKTYPSRLKYRLLCTSMNVLNARYSSCYMTNIPGVTIAGVGYFDENNEFVSFENGSVGVHDTWYKLAGVTPTLLEGVDQTDQTHMRAVNGTYYIRNNATVYGTKYNTQIEAPQTNINLDSATMIYEGNKEYSYVVEQGGVKYTISTTSAVGTGTYQQPAIQVTKVGNETADNVNNYYYINGSLNIVNLGTLKEQTLSLSGVSASDDHTTISTSNEIGNCSISITSITYNGTGYPYNKDKTPTSFTIDANNVVWIGSNVIGIIQGNGGQNTTVKFINGVTSFKYTVTGIGDYENSNCKILEFTKQVNDETSVSLENIAAALKSVANLKNLTDNSIDALVYDNDTSTYTGANQIYIYLTRAAAVTVSTTFDVWNGDGQTTLSKTIFMNVTDTDVVFNPAFERAGYDLTGIKPVSNVMDVTDGFTLNFNANNASRVNPVTIEAIWTPKKAADIEINNATSKEFTANETERTAFSASSFIESVTGFKPSEYDCTWVKTGTDTLELLNSDDAGEYTINIKLKDYNVTYTTKINITCNLQEVSMTVRDSFNNNLGNSTYDGTDKIFGYNILLSNNLVKTGTDAYFTLAWSKDNADVTEAKNVGTYKLTVKLTELGKKVYKFAGDATELTFSFEIGKAALTLPNVTKVYDGTTDFDSSMGTLSGVVGGEDIAVTGKFDSKDVTATKVSDFTIVGATKDNYSIKAEFSAIITPKSLTLTDVTKVYDGTTAFDSSMGKLKGVVDGETITVTGTFNSEDVATATKVSGLIINGETASNYTIKTEVDATISPKKLTITVEKEYDGSEGFTNEKATIEGLVSIDEVSDEVTVKGNFSNANVKASEIITDYALGGKDAGNYTVESITGTINKITDISGFGIKGVSYTYREMLKPADNKWETNLNGIDLKFTKGGAETTLVSGNITFEIKPNDILDEIYSVGGALKVGKYNITLTIKSDTVEDFDAVLTIEITKLDITVELREGADNLPELSKIYDGTADLPAGIRPYADFKGDNVEIAAKFENAKVGENKNIIYSVTGDDKDNYNYTYSIKTGTIGKFEFTKITLNNSNGNIGFVDGDVTGNVEITDKYELNESFNPSNFIATLNSKMNGVSKVGYTRATKWYTDANFYEEITEENITKILMRYASQNISEITFYSQWERNSWKLSLDGQIVDSPVLYYDELGSRLTPPTLTGYTFQGWFDGETKYIETSKMPNNDLALTPKWVANTYTVKFDGNGATAGEMADREFTYDSTTIPACTFSKTGYTFSGWNTLQTPTEENPGIAYKEGDKNLIAEGEITLYAQWVANKYTVVLDLNNGSFNEAPADWTKNADGNYERKVSYDESFVLPVPTKEEYNFNGWKFGEETKNGTVLNLTDINNGSVKLVAQWTKGDYTFTVNLVDEAENQISNSGIAYYTISLEDGTSVGANAGANNEFTLNKDKVYKITVITGTGYTFDSYTVNPEGALTVEQAEKVLTLKSINSATSITIKITENKYTITASANSGTFDETQLNGWTLSEDKLSATKTISFSASYFPMPVVTRKGYTFKGWFVGVTKIEDSTALSTAGDHSVEARWEANTYDVTINYNGDHVTVKRVDGQNEYDVADGKLNVKTGDIIVLKATAKQHYENVQVKAEGVTVISNAETSQYTISGFTEAFTIDITADPVKYSVEIDMIAVSGNQVQSETSNSARLAVGETVYVDNSGKLDIAYGSSYTYTATLATGYEFDGWYDSVTVVDGIVTARGNKISEALTYAGTVSGDYKLIAVFKLGEFDVKVKVDGGHGTFNYGSVENQSEYTTKIQLDSTVIITPVAARGYEFKEWLLDGVVLTESNTEKGIAYAADGALTLTGKANIDLQVRFTPSSGSFEMDTELSINGIVIDGSASGCVATRVGTLDASGKFVANDSIPPFMNGTIPFVTDTDVYLQIEVSYGYSFNGLITVGTGDTKTIIVDSDYNPAATTVGTGLDQKTIYVRKIKNLNSADNYGTLRVKIEAVAVSLTVNFISDNREVNAGRIFVDDERFGIITSGNAGPSVTIQAMITEEIDITAFTRFNYTIVESDYYKLTRTATITNTLRETVTDRRNGFTSSFKFSVSKYVMGTVVSIKVIPEVYNVELYDGATKIGETITGVKAGDRLNTSNHIDLISELATSRAGYELKGFYTAENGCGELYIDGQGICGKAWEETGFYWDGENYQISPSYNSATNAIKLYAGWARWKSAVTLYTAPKALRELAPTVAATQVITSLNTANSWTTAGNIFFADILYGADVIIEAPVYENYVFNCWTIVLDGVKQDPIYESVYFKEDGFNSRVVDIYANYNTKVILEAGNGGTAKLTAGETVIEAGNEGYIPTNVPFTLIATPDEGYTFAGWYNVFNDELISTEERYVYPASDDNEIGAMTIQARFTGKPVQISVGDYDKTYGYIQKVYLNSELKTQGDALEPIDAKMGDVVEFYVILSTMKKYGVKWNSDNIAYYGRENIDKVNQICYIYRYIVSVEDVKDNKIVIVPTITEELITIKVEVKLNDNSDYTEAGEVEVDGLVNDTISISYGSQLDITVKVNDYYRIRSVQLDNRSIGEYLAGDVLSIPSSILNELGTGVHVLKIEFAEKLWIESNNLPSSLEGDGTERSPYIIATAEDLAFLAYKLNKEKDQSYANSRFILVNDISLIGKFWNPIGVDDCKYNSVFNFNGFKVYGLRLASGVDESRTTYNGVFYEIGQKAEIILNNNALVIVAVSVSVGVALIIIGVVVYLVVRRRRKKRMEELSNG